MHSRYRSSIAWIVRNRWSIAALLWLSGFFVVGPVALAAEAGLLPNLIGRLAVIVYFGVMLFCGFSRELATAARYRRALRFYADLGADEIPYADEITDPPDIGRTAREALAVGPSRR